MFTNVSVRNFFQILLYIDTKCVEFIQLYEEHRFTPPTLRVYKKITPHFGHFSKSV